MLKVKNNLNCSENMQTPIIRWEFEINRNDKVNFLGNCHGQTMKISIFHEMFMEFTVHCETIKMFPVYCTRSLKSFQITKTFTHTHTQNGAVRFCEWQMVNVNAISVHGVHGFSTTEWNINMCVLVLLWKCRIMLLCLCIIFFSFVLFFFFFFCFVLRLSGFRMCFALLYVIHARDIVLHTIFFWLLIYEVTCDWLRQPTTTTTATTQKTAFSLNFLLSCVCVRH